MELTPTKTIGISKLGRSWDDRKDQSGSEQGQGVFGSRGIRPSKRAELRYYASTAASGEKFKSVATL
jgi:hypothetical protein